MNNNDSDKKSVIQQEESEQLVWERLQNEAIAAQRWRLEQEMKQAGKQPVSASRFELFWTRLLPWPNRFVVVAVASFITASLVFAFYCIR